MMYGLRSEASMSRISCSKVSSHSTVPYLYDTFPSFRRGRKSTKPCRDAPLLPCLAWYVDFDSNP